MIRRRANAAGIERAVQKENHSSTCSMQLYERRAEDVTLNEVERILI
jgi:hypothetical protein